MDAREKRLALNEVMFREINDRLESRIQTLTTDGEAQLAVLCECAKGGMTMVIATHEIRCRAGGSPCLVLAGGG